MSSKNLPDIEKLRKDLREFKKALKKEKQINSRLKCALGGDILRDWEPNPDIERQYGWVYAWLYPLRSFLNQNLNQPLTPDLRNKVHELVTSIISQLAVRDKYGIHLPIDPLPIEQSRFSHRQNQIFEEKYNPCDICGETRITHECHIVPRSEGGVYHSDNLVVLCPLHHHLFDHSCLSEDEWGKLITVI
jgi:hypothetical protein